jgi:hypothetical protein
LSVTGASAADAAEELSRRALGAVYRVTQPYLAYYAGNPTPGNIHAGIDLGAPAGTPVGAVASGTVINAPGGNGRLSTFAIWDGQNTVIYLHMTGLATSLQGQNISVGTPIGRVGSEGAASPHLHVEVRRGKQTWAVGPTSEGRVEDLTLDPVAYLVPSVSAAAPPSITSLNPSSVSGSRFTLTITGSGFDPSGAVDQFYKPDGSFLGQGVIQSRTSSRIVVTEQMAGAAPGNYTVKVKNPDGQLSNGMTLTLVAQVSVSPSSGTPGMQFSYQGSGFTGNFGVTSHLRRPDGTKFPTLQIPSNASGQFTSTINSTGFAAGTYQVWAIDNNTGVSSNVASFTVGSPSPPPVSLPAAEPASPAPPRLPLSTYRDGILLRTRNNTTIYVMENGRRRAIPDEATFFARGWRFQNLIIIDDEELGRIPLGPEIPRSQPPAPPSAPAPAAPGGNEVGQTKNNGVYEITIENAGVAPANDFLFPCRRTAEQKGIWVRFTIRKLSREHPDAQTTDFLLVDETNKRIDPCTGTIFVGPIVQPTLHYIVPRGSQRLTFRFEHVGAAGPITFELSNLE